MQDKQKSETPSEPSRRDFLRATLAALAGGGATSFAYEASQGLESEHERQRREAKEKAMQKPTEWTLLDGGKFMNDPKLQESLPAEKLAHRAGEAAARAPLTAAPGAIIGTLVYLNATKDEKPSAVRSSGGKAIAADTKEEIAGESKPVVSRRGFLNKAGKWFGAATVLAGGVEVIQHRRYTPDGKPILAFEDDERSFAKRVGLDYAYGIGGAAGVAVLGYGAAHMVEDRMGSPRPAGINPEGNARHARKLLQKERDTERENRERG